MSVGVEQATPKHPKGIDGIRYVGDQVQRHRELCESRCGVSETALSFCAGDPVDEVNVLRRTNEPWNFCWWVLKAVVQRDDRIEACTPVAVEECIVLAVVAQEVEAGTVVSFLTSDTIVVQVLSVLSSSTMTISKALRRWS